MRTSSDKGLLSWASISYEAEAARQAVLENSDDFYIEYGEGAEDFFLGTALGIASTQQNALNAKNWNLLESPAENFVTSDHPVVLLRPEGFPPLVAIGFEQARILFPISPKRCLILSNESVPKEYWKRCLLNCIQHPIKTFGSQQRRVIEIDEGEAWAINQSIISQAHESVFSKELSAELERHFNG